MELRSGRRTMPAEQAEASCQAPPYNRRRQVPRKEVCRLCRQADCDPEVVGQLCREGHLRVHENCLYHAAGLIQRGADEEGFYGFLFPDIREELKRVAQKKCCICGMRGASVSCQGRVRGRSLTGRRRHCSRNFHLPCGTERGCVSQFFRYYRSFCWAHRPVQRVRAVQREQTPCLICLEPVAERLCFDTMVCPVCASAWFHRRCVQGLALRCGLHHFRCPVCRDLDAFRTEMLRMGIKVPDRDAAWEEEQGFAAQYERHGTCDAEHCLCPAGREQQDENGPWRLLLCSSCASSGTHRPCAGLGEDVEAWDCEGCSGVGIEHLADASPGPSSSGAGTFAQHPDSWHLG